jgi:hypothetical protein
LATSLWYCHNVSMMPPKAAGRMARLLLVTGLLLLLQLAYEKATLPCGGCLCLVTAV